jgi:hypothetical protein
VEPYIHKFTFSSSIHNLNTRQRLKLYKPAAHLKLYQGSPYYTCIQIYNKLPDDLASQVTNKKQFLLKLKKYLIERPYYTLREFMNAQWGGEMETSCSVNDFIVKLYILFVKLLYRNLYCCKLTMFYDNGVNW